MEDYIFTPHDVVLTSNDGQSLSFWKKRLIQESRYFEKLFSSNMKDSSLSEYILDISYKNMREVMIFLMKHTSNWEKLLPKIEEDSDVIEVYIFAQKYMFDNVFEIMEHKLHNCVYSRFLLEFSRTYNPVNINDRHLAGLLLHRYGGWSALELSSEDIDEAIWMEVAKAYDYADLLHLISTEHLLDNDMREKIVNAMPEVCWNLSVDEFVKIASEDVTLLQTSIFYAGIEDAKWFIMMNKKIRDGMDRYEIKWTQLGFFKDYPWIKYPHMFSTVLKDNASIHVHIPSFMNDDLNYDSDESITKFYIDTKHNLCERKYCHKSMSVCDSKNIEVMVNIETGGYSIYFNIEFKINLDDKPKVLGWSRPICDTFLH